MGRWRSTGFGVFVLGTGMGLITNLVTDSPERWPRALQPVATYSPAIGAGLLLAVGARAAWVVWRSGYRRPEWHDGNPYPGLVAYTPRWAGVFFGRGREIAELLDRVRDVRGVTGRFVPVVGPSGSGKSSLVLAGLVPVLGAGFRVPEAFTPGTDATGELATVLGVDLTEPAREALRAARSGEPAPPLDGPLAALGRLRQGARRLLLVVDQLEEAVTQCVEQDRHAFLALLEALLEQEPRLRVVATVRSDTIGEFQQGPGCGLFRDPLMVNVLGPREIRVVVEEPARMTGTRFDDGLVDEIVRDTGGGDALPLLNYLLSDLYRTAARDRHVSWREYEVSGGVSGAIARRADAAARGFGPDALRECLDTLLRFVTLAAGGATRQRVPATVLTERQREIVRSFVDARLLTSDRDDDGRVRYDVAHEALLRQWPPLREYIQLHEDNLRRLTELVPLARAWHRAGRSPDYLITGARLADALAWSRTGQGVGEDLREFLDAAERSQAGELERRADRAARQALGALPADPALARSLALAACTELSCTPLAAYALEAAVASGLLLVGFVPGGGALVAVGPGGHLLVAGGTDGLLALGPDGRSSAPRLPAELVSRRSVTAFATDPAGRMALAGRDGTVVVGSGDGLAGWSVEVGTRRLTALAFPGAGLVAVAAADGMVTVLDQAGRTVWAVDSGHGPVYQLAAGPGGGLTAACADGSVVVWGEGPEPRSVLSGHTDCVLAVCVAPDGRIASGSRDRCVRVWDRTGTPIGVHQCGGAVNAVAFDALGTLAAGEDGGTVRVWSPDRTLRHLLTEGGEPVRSLAFTDDGRLAAGFAAGIARVWDVYGRLVVQAAGTRADCLAFDRAGRLAIGGPAGLRLWTDRAEPGCLVTDEPVTAVAFAADGRLTAVTRDGRVLVHEDDVGSADLVTAHLAGAGLVTAVGWSADGRLLTGSADGAVRSWDRGGRSIEVTGSVQVTGSGGPITAVGDGWHLAGDTLLDDAGTPLHPGPVRAVASAGDRLVVGTRSGLVDRLDHAGRPHALAGHESAVRAAAFAPDGRFATGDDNGTVIVWSGDGERLRAIDERPGPVRALAFDPDGRLAVAAGDIVRVWPHRTEPGRLIENAARHAGRALTRQERDAAQLPRGADGEQPEQPEGPEEGENAVAA
jgi:WD40 repeat protein